MADQDQQNFSQSDAGEWTPCDEGSLGGFASKERFRKLSRRAVSVAGAAASLCVLVVAVGYLPGLNVFPGQSSGNPSRGNSSNELNYVGAFPPYGGLTCSDVLHDLDPFFADSISQERHGRIRQHLDDCASCSVVYHDAAKSRGVPIAHLHQERRSGQATVSILDSSAVSKNAMLPLVVDSHFLANR